MKPTLFCSKTLIPLVIAEEAFWVLEASKSREGLLKDKCLKQHQVLKQQWLDAVSELLHSPDAPKA
jgi:hypothetical protein